MDAQLAQPCPPRLRVVALAAVVLLLPYLHYMFWFNLAPQSTMQVGGPRYLAWVLGQALAGLFVVLLAVGCRRLDREGRQRVDLMLALLVLLAAAALADDQWRAQRLGSLYRFMPMSVERDRLSEWFYHWRSAWAAVLLLLVAAYADAWAAARMGDRARRREWRARAALALSAPLLLLVVLEVGLRAGWVGEPWAAFEGGTEVFRVNPVLGWSNRPGVVTEQYAKEFRVQVRINQHGVRDRDIGYAKPPGQRRILFLGDSFTFGAGVERAQRFGELLGATRPQVETINAGVIGYGTDQEYLYYTNEGYRYQADLVVLALFSGNDFYENGRPSGLGFPKPMFGFQGGRLDMYYIQNCHGRPIDEVTEPFSFRRYLRSWQYLARLVFMVREGRELRRRLPQPAPAHLDALPPAADTAWLEAPELAVRPDRYQVTGALLAALRAAVQAQGAKLLVLLIPSPRCLGTPQPKDPLWLADARNQRAARDLCRELALPTVDPLPELTALEPNGPPLYYELDGHWTPAGHAAAAELLGPVVDKLLHER